MKYVLEPSNNIYLLARAGGGGSSSSGGGGGGSSSSSSSRSSSSSSGGSGGDLPWWGGLLIFAIFLVPFILILIFGKKIKGVATVPSGYIDPNKKGSEEEKKITEMAKSIFLSFQKAWSEYDTKTMQKILASEYYKKMALELNVLKNYQRQNIMKNVNISGAYILKSNDYTQTFNVFFAASAQDELVDNKENKTIYTDTSVFSEIWTFAKKGNSYVLDKITQTTADASKFNTGIAEFAVNNNFYYDPDFGWLMMPSRGAIFGPAGFGNADINNHVIGYYGAGNKAKIVQFYSYEPKAGQGMKPFTVAQAILPKHYDDILVTQKSWYDFKPKGKDLRKIETESVEFNKKFTVWAHSQDQVASFELLATNFMERIYEIDFEINIEVVDNVLYLYSPDTNIAYSEMLEVLSWAFDEMKM